MGFQYVVLNLSLSSSLNACNSSCPDGYQPKGLKETTKQLAIPLTILYKKYFNSQGLPNDCGLANITHIYKRAVTITYLIIDH